MSNSFAIDMTSDLSVEVSFTQQLCVIIDSPRALTVFLLLKYQEFNQLVDLTIDPSLYEDHGNFADDYLVTEVLSKSSNLPLGRDREQVALDSFYESEKSCKELNDNFSHSLPFPGMSDVSRYIGKILGPLSSSVLNSIQDGFRFGPGATTGVKGSGCVLSDKYDEDIHLTSELIPFYRVMLGDRWWEHQRNPQVVPGSKFTTVPKNAKTDRGIAIEPTLNIYGQLGVGKHIRGRLRKFGVDLNTQERNQTLASLASTEKLATIDLKAASDSISWRVIQCLFPNDWFELLTLFRSHFIQIDGKSVELEKISSMGNGYTFELESLLFTAVVHSYVPKHLHHLTAIYGDDIIVPQQFADDVVDALKFLGFSVNLKKSFLAGRFFESCGSDWFDNRPVRPFYLRKSSSGGIPYTLQIANSLRLYSRMRMAGMGCDMRFRTLWLALYKATPKVWQRCKVPESLGDTGFIVSKSEARTQKPRGHIQGHVVLHMDVAPVKVRKTTTGLLLSMLARAVSPDIPTYGREPKRGYLGNYRPKKAIVFQWSEGFRWI